MKPNVKNRELESKGVESSAEFGISLEHSAHIMTILRDTLYSDKVLAVEREYVANAWDAHRSIGKGDVPIKIVVPTALEPTFVVRDFGPGLSHEDVFQVYTQYGASTKRNDDTTVGMLGIGSKSGFAYSDSFSITSWNGGVKRIYVAVLDKSEKGVINLLHEEPCGEETGIEIKIAVKAEDIEEFRAKALSLFVHLEPRPDINMELPALMESRQILKHGYIYKNSEASSEGTGTGWIAVMGCVPYRINLSQVKNSDGSNGLASFLQNISGVIKFDIGEVQINASREELKYSADTKKALVDKINTVVDEYVTCAVSEIMDSQWTPWERRIKAQVLRELGVPLSEDVKEITKQFVDVSKDPLVPTSFIFTHLKAVAISSFGVRENTRLVLKDDNRAVRGFNFSSNDVLVRKIGKLKSWKDVEAELDVFLQKRGLVGIPIIRTSEMEWQKRFYDSGGGRQHNPLHHKKTFKLKEGHSVYRSRNRSRSWEAVMRTPQPDDVFVVLSEFWNTDLGRHYQEDQRTAEAIGREMPVIYGYKTTEKNPIVPANIPGTVYGDWRRTFFSSVLTDKLKALIVSWKWSNAPIHLPASKQVQTIMKKLVAGLGKNHQVVQVLRRTIRERKLFVSASEGTVEVIESLYDRVKDKFDPKDMETAYAELHERYPLLSPNGLHYSRRKLDELWDARDGAEWIRYVKLIDQDLERKANAHQVHADEQHDRDHSRGEGALDSEGVSELPSAERRAAE